MQKFLELGQLYFPGPLYSLSIKRNFEDETVSLKATYHPKNADLYNLDVKMTLEVFEESPRGAERKLAQMSFSLHTYVMKQEPKNYLAEWSPKPGVRELFEVTGVVLCEIDLPKLGKGYWLVKKLKWTEALPGTRIPDWNLEQWSQLIAARLAVEPRDQPEPA